jgi:molecular chaperone GrpE
MADNDNQNEDILPEDVFRDAGPGPASPEVESLKSEIAALKDRALRALADAENTRKRAEREKADTSQYAVAGFARSLLPVADNLRRALDALHADKRAMDDTQKAIVEGVEATSRELNAVLEKHGVKLIAAEGARFDPNLHHAVAEVPGSGQPAGTVVNVIQSGYTIGERLLRPAMVTVAKAEPAPAPGGTQH